MAKSKIRPTEGEFDIDEDREIFAQKYFWNLLISQDSFKELFKNLSAKFEISLNYPQNEWNLQFDLENWINSFHFSNGQHRNWLYVQILNFVEMRNRFPGYPEEKHQFITLRECMPRYAPKVKGLQLWLYNDFTAAEYIESQRLQALEDLNETNFVSLPHRVKSNIANERAKQAESYTKEVLANLKRDGFNLKPTTVSPKYEKQFEWLTQVYFDRKQFAEIALIENEDITNVSREVNKLAKLLGFSKPSHIKQGRKKGSLNNPITSKLGKN